MSERRPVGRPPRPVTCASCLAFGPVLVPAFLSFPAPWPPGLPWGPGTQCSTKVTHREFPFAPLGPPREAFLSPSALLSGLDSSLTCQSCPASIPGDFIPARTAARPGGGGPASGGEGVTAAFGQGALCPSGRRPLTGAGPGRGDSWLGRCQMPDSLSMLGPWGEARRKGSCKALCFGCELTCSAACRAPAGGPGLQGGLGSGALRTPSSQRSQGRGGSLACSCWGCLGGRHTPKTPAYSPERVGPRPPPGATGGMGLLEQSQRGKPRPGRESRAQPVGGDPGHGSFAAIGRAGKFEVKGQGHR